LPDVTSLRAFPSPQHPGNLSLILGLPARGPADGSFSPDVVYRFKLRPLMIERREIVVACSFGAPRAGQDGTCTTSDGRSARFTVGAEAGGRGDGLRVFAGLRSPASGSHGSRLLAIVVELDCLPWLLDGSGPLFAVAAEPVAADVPALVVDVTKPYAVATFPELESDWFPYLAPVRSGDGFRQAS
jgi:hypothetical protein